MSNWCTPSTHYTDVYVRLSEQTLISIHGCTLQKEWKTEGLSPGVLGGTATAHKKWDIIPARDLDGRGSAVRKEEGWAICCHTGSSVQCVTALPSRTYPHSKVPSNNDNIKLVAETIHILWLDLHPTTAYNIQKKHPIPIHSYPRSLALYPHSAFM